MIVVAQQHGNEAISSNGMISLIRALSSNAKEAKYIRSELTVYIVPRVNIDGFDATPTGEPWRYNVDPNVCPPAPEPCPPFSSRNRGYDINRYHPYLTAYPLDNPNTDAPDNANPVPESLNCRWLYDMAGGAADVEVVLDLHGQGTPLDANRDMVFSSTLWPTATPTADDTGSGPSSMRPRSCPRRLYRLRSMPGTRSPTQIPASMLAGRNPGSRGMHTGSSAPPPSFLSIAWWGRRRPATWRTSRSGR